MHRPGDEVSFWFAVVMGIGSMIGAGIRCSRVFHIDFECYSQPGSLVARFFVMTRLIRFSATAPFLFAAVPAPAVSDDIENSLRMALEAYQAGDVKAAKEEADFAAQLLAQMQAAGLSEFLPDALADWTRMEVENQAQSAAMFGGGMSASATYIRGNDRIEIKLMADNQMVTSMAAMFSNTQMMGSMGQVKRIGRQKVILTQAGDLQAMVNNHIYIQVSGRAPAEDKEAYFAALDIRGLEEF